MDPIEIEAILSDMMSPVMAAIADAAQTMADTLTAAMSQVSDAVTQATTSTDALQGAMDQTTVSADALAGSLDAASGAVDANTAAEDANAASTDAAAGAHSKLASVAKAAIMPLGLAAAAVAGIGVAAVHMAGDFQEGVNSLATGAGESQSNLQLVSDGIMQIAQATGESTKQLIEGMYMIESAGYHGKAGLAVLQAAAEGAKVGNADLGTVADATTTILTDFGKSGITAAGAVNLLVATTASGKTHMSDLAQSLAQILPTASSAGIGLNDVMGAMATMTGEGVPAANAATYLRQTIIALEAPSKQTVTALKSVGLTSEQVATAMHKSLPDALKLITDAVGKKFPVGSAQYVAALKAISGGSKQMQGMLDLTGTHLATFKQNTENVAGAVKKGGNSVNGWALTQQAFNTQLSQAGATLQVAMIKIGQALMPVAMAFVHNLMPALQWVIAHGPLVATVLGVLAAVIGGALAAALWVTAAAWWAVNGAAVVSLLPFLAIGAAIGLLIAGVVLLYTHFKPFRDAVNAVGHALQSAAIAVTNGIGAAFNWLGTQVHLLGMRFQIMRALVSAEIARVQLTIERVFAFIGGLFPWLYNHNTYVKKLVDTVHAQFERAKLIVTIVMAFLKGKIQQAWETIVADAKAAWQRFIAPIENAVGLAKTAIGHVTDAVKGPVTNLIGLASGWGSKLIQMFINGIKSMAGNVGNAAKDIAGQVAKFLGFHSPAEAGPGADADEWAPNLGRMFTGGLLGQRRTVGQAAGALADALAGPFTGGSGVAGLAGRGAAGLIGSGGSSVSDTGVARVDVHLHASDAGLALGIRLLDRNTQYQLAGEIAEEMARRGFLQGKQPIPYTGHN